MQKTKQKEFMKMTTKEELIQTLIKGGMAQADAEKAVTDVIPKGSTDADLMREIDMLKAEVKVRNTQLRQAIDIAQRVNDERKAREDAEKTRLIDSLIIDGKFNKDDLAKNTLAELQIMRTTIDKALEKTFVSVAAELDAENKKHEPYLTVGAWDAKTQSWKGGL